MKYAPIIITGRKEVKPVNKKALRWFEGKEAIFSMKSKKVDPKDFVGKAKEKIDAMIGSIIG